MHFLSCPFVEATDRKRQFFSKATDWLKEKRNLMLACLTLSFVVFGFGFAVDENVVVGDSSWSINWKDIFEIERIFIFTIEFFEKYFSTERDSYSMVLDDFQRDFLTCWISEYCFQ